MLPILLHFCQVRPYKPQIITLVDKRIVGFTQTSSMTPDLAWRVATGFYHQINCGVQLYKISSTLHAAPHIPA